VSGRKPQTGGGGRKSSNRRVELETLRRNQTPTAAGTFHRQARIKAFGREAVVDVGVATLVANLWADGFDTISSCENGAEAFIQDNVHPAAAYVGMPIADYRRWFTVNGEDPGYITPDAVAGTLYFALDGDGGCQWLLSFNEDGSFQHRLVTSQDIAAGVK
jgi:hypothetical protein